MSSFSKIDLRSSVGKLLETEGSLKRATQKTTLEQTKAVEDNSQKADINVVQILEVLKIDKVTQKKIQETNKNLGQIIVILYFTRAATNFQEASARYNCIRQY